jgi:hypothetical protein
LSYDEDDDPLARDVRRLQPHRGVNAPGPPTASARVPASAWEDDLPMKLKDYGGFYPLFLIGLAVATMLGWAFTGIVLGD